ncbi:MAG: uncharacterized protein K0R38_5821 [Polyangiaceae bacterium]|jgi:hypothetical protein|nr:uncharacterized protein [Polyangiaceae bacterium]
MSDPALQAFLALVQRELGADDAYLQLGGKAADGGGRIFHAVGEATSVVATFAEPPADTDAVHARLAALSATFGMTLDSAVADVGRPRHIVDFARQRLDEELSGLSQRAGAVRAFVFDLDSPVIWGASSLAAPDAAATQLVERAMRLLRERSDELRQAQGHTIRLTLEADVEALARPFAGLYVLALLFREPLSEPIALGAVLHAVGLIERLVLALPPIDPEPGAKIIRLHGPSSSRQD